VIEIDEVGTTAAAATAAVIMSRCMKICEELVLNRAFYFAVHAGSNDICLFQGVLNA